MEKTRADSLENVVKVNHLYPALGLTGAGNIPRSGFAACRNIILPASST
jgi:hypothetical protein